MAKKPTPTTSTNDATVAINVPADFTITSHGHTLSTGELSTMSPKAVAYLLANGYKQSLTDAAAFTKEAKAGKSALEVSEMANTKRAARHDAILKGEVGAVSGARATPIERVMRTVAVERIRAIALAKGKKMPTKELLDVAIERLMAKQGPDIRAEAEARISASTAAAADVEDILG